MGELGVPFCCFFVHNSLMNILQKIFTDHYEEIKYTLHPRNTEMENIDKMINCGDPSFGGAMYACPHYGKLKFVPFRCKSRFCPTCGNKYAMERTTNMSFKLVNATHRHCVFTIDENLRDFFLKDRCLLDCLFHAVNSVVSRMFLKQNQSMNFTPGFIMVLHTFGRDLKWNPHIHCLISEGGYSDSGFWRNVNHGDFVTFHYNRHKDNKYVEETLPVMDFIKRLIRHIPEKHYKMIRYGGLYARHREIDKKLHRAISREKHHIYRSFNQWRTAILLSFGYDPLKCECGTTMLFLELYFNHKRVSLEEMYENVMSRSRGKRSSA